MVNSLKKLLNYIEKHNYTGYDPYDALKSPLFKLPFLNSNKFIRFSVQQLIKRFPKNLRHLLFIPKGYNPVTLGLCIQSYGYLSEIFPAKKYEFFAKADFLISELHKMKSSGFSGTCWGYDFDWEARYAKIPAFQPTIVATGIISNGLFEYYKISNNSEALNLCKGIVPFILNDLNRTYENNTFCFSYSPIDHQIVYNASMKGARLLSQIYSITGDKELIDTANQAVEFVINKQNNNGSWYYSDKSKRIDNYHTGYVLDCLNEFIHNTRQIKYNGSLAKGYKYYKDNFFVENRFPKFNSNSVYPLDCTAASQSILTLIRFNDIELAQQVAEFVITQMQSQTGYFYFRKFKNYTIKIPYMRWSNAWMLTAITYLLYKLSKTN